MKSKFDFVSAHCSKFTTCTYSTSFSLGINFLNIRLRSAIYSIYGFVRFADEIVDSFEGYDKKYLLEKFKSDTYDALSKRISLNPILNSFQHTVYQYKIDHDLIEKFLLSMEMDLTKIDYSQEKYEQYIFGSAEVVGLMCLHVFTETNSKLYEELKPYSMKLGSAFQKVNFLRDMKDDYTTLGRVYFPNIEFSTFNSHAKAAIESEIEKEFKDALIGIKKLPSSSKGGVYLAYVYYYSLFKKIKNVSVQKILDGRIRISNGKKFGLMVNSLIQYKMNLV